MQALFVGGPSDGKSMLMSQLNSVVVLPVEGQFMKFVRYDMSHCVNGHDWIYTYHPEG